MKIYFAVFNFRKGGKEIDETALGWYDTFHSEQFTEG